MPCRSGSSATTLKGFRAEGVLDLGFRASGSGCGLQGLGFRETPDRASGLGGLGLKVLGDRASDERFGVCFAPNQVWRIEV